MLTDVLRTKDHIIIDRGSAEDPFLKANAEELHPYVSDNWTPGIDYEGLFKDNQVVLLGDTNHNQHGMLGGITAELENMREAGVKHIAFEIPDGKQYTESLENFYATGDVSHIKWIAEQTRTPVRLTRFLKRAYDLNIQVHFVDLDSSQRKPEWDYRQECEERGIHMGKRVAELAIQTGDKIISFTGYGHFNNNQIPHQLDDQSIRYKKLALVSAGQAALGIIDTHFISMGATRAVSFEGLSQKVGTVYFGNEDYGLEGFIHLPRVSLIKKNPEGTVTLLPARDQVNPNEGAIVPLKSGINLPALSIDMVHEIEPSSHNWESTNNEKVFQFVDSMQGLSDGQKLYLGIMLETYIRTSMRHGGGSVSNIEYDPESEAFGIDTIDTCGYPVKPGVDYGSRARHREVTLNTLLNQHGFNELIVKNLEDLPETDVQPNLNTAGSAYKLLILASAYARDPERIKIHFSDAHGGTQSVAVTDRTGRNYLVKIGIEDFELSKVEKRLLVLGDRVTEVYELSDYLFGSILDTEKEFLDPRDAYKEAFGSIEDLLKHPRLIYLADRADGLIQRLTKSEKALGIKEDYWDLVMETTGRLDYLVRKAKRKLRTVRESKIPQRLNKIIEEGVLPIASRLSEYVVRAMVQLKGSETEIDFDYYRTLDTMSRIMCFSVYPAVLNAKSDFVSKILKSRAKLEYLGADSALELIAEKEKAFGEIVDKLKRIEELGSNKSKRLQTKTFEEKGITYTFDQALKANQDLWQEVLEELADIKGMITQS